MSCAVVAVLLTIMAAVPEASSASGAALYRDRCAPCHGARGQGARFAPRIIAGLPENQVRKVLVEGRGKMKPIQGASADQIAAIAKHVSTLR